MLHAAGTRSTLRAPTRSTLRAPTRSTLRAHAPRCALPHDPRCAHTLHAARPPVTVSLTSVEAWWPSATFRRMRRAQHHPRADRVHGLVAEVGSAEWAVVVLDAGNA